MNVKALRDQLSAFDDDTEVFLAPLMTATRVGDVKPKMKVPHPLRRFGIVKLSVVGDIKPGNTSAGKRFVVLSFDQDANEAAQASVREPLTVHRER